MVPDGLAGTLWTCVTGRWPLDYDAAGLGRTTPLAVRRAAIAERAIPTAFGGHGNRWVMTGGVCARRRGRPVSP